MCGIIIAMMKQTAVFYHTVCGNEVVILRRARVLQKQLLGNAESLAAWQETHINNSMINLTG